MKKTYINPEMEIVNVEVQQMLAVSVGISGLQANENALSRDFGWDEEDY